MRRFSSANGRSFERQRGRRSSYPTLLQTVLKSYFYPLDMSGLAPGTRAVVIDNGSGYTKCGYAGNVKPDYVFPTVIAAADEGGSDISGSSRDGLRDLDFCLGDMVSVWIHPELFPLNGTDSTGGPIPYRVFQDTPKISFPFSFFSPCAAHPPPTFSPYLSQALANTKHTVNYPVKHGLIENWTNMERIWQRCFFEHMRCDPEEAYVVLTEPPLNPPENREYTAEVMFETFNVPGIHIGVQAVLALAAAFVGSSVADRTLTGTVIDSGDGTTHVIPVADGYVIGGAIRHIPLGGRDITAYVQRCLRERGEPVPPEESLDIARRIKEEHWCVVPVGAAVFSLFF